MQDCPRAKHWPTTTVCGAGVDAKGAGVGRGATGAGVTGSMGAGVAGSTGARVGGSTGAKVGDIIGAGVCGTCGAGVTTGADVLAPRIGGGQPV